MGVELEKLQMLSDGLLREKVKWQEDVNLKTLQMQDMTKFNGKLIVD